ncbi:hypothetical protein [Acidiferrimicrobium sp. IK]|uniref:hypothetical protein n=1 Tax=Acidiferrimicrobium sp. IK TaxID=2871700 RepID=UPI0021CB6EF1|nr:hypothetical protein [Acidiferrimicrobium sp. IK]
MPTQGRTVAETARRVAASAASGSGAEAFRLLIQLCDTLDAEPLATRGALCATPAQPTGDSRYDAFIAAAVEHFLAAARLPVPAWTDQPSRFVTPLWFVAGIPGYEADAYLSAPASFFRHGVMINSSELASA